jgi:hypothetical protein
MENQTQSNPGIEKRAWKTPKLEVLSQKRTLGGLAAGPEQYGAYYTS